MKNPLTYVYIGIGILALFFGTVVSDLLDLGIRQAYINIIEKAITALLIGVGLAMQQLGVPVPEFPPKGENGVK
jgi:hypothetical protein